MASRSCTRCGKGLEDAASQEAGIGPVCRKMDNAVLAQTFPADIEEARRLLEARGWDNFPASLRPKLDEIVAELYTVAHSGDWRVVVKRIEYLLSYDETQAWRNTLTYVVRSLGYVGLAALWQGYASSGAAQAFYGPVEIGSNVKKLFVQGSRNKYARAALRKIGARLYGPTPTTGTGASWGVNAQDHAAFERIVLTYYPRCSGLMEAIASAKQDSSYMVAQGMDMAKRKEVRIEEFDRAGKKAYRVFTPWNSEFIGELKVEVHYSGRAWNPTQKCWEIQAPFMPTVVGLLKKHYHTEVVEPSAVAPAQTPAKEVVVLQASPTKVIYDSPNALPF